MFFVSVFDVFVVWVWFQAGRRSRDRCGGVIAFALFSSDLRCNEVKLIRFLVLPRHLVII
jgi:hypothetical protein